MTDDGGPSYTARDLADRLGGSVEGSAERWITGVNSLLAAGGGDITFLTGPAYVDDWVRSQAGAALVPERLHIASDDQRALIRVPNVELSLIALLELFAPSSPRVIRGVHPTAWVDPSAVVDSSAAIGPHVSVGPRAIIGQRVVLHAGVRVYEGAVIGDDSILHSNVVIRERCELRHRVILHQGVSIGADGFGYRPSPDGSGLQKMPHLGNVVLDDDVEIGANSCIDRGKFGPTEVGRGTKIDNLCQIGHNCRIGRSCVIAAMCAMGGSVTIGDGVQIGGAAAFADHVTIDAGARIGGGSKVIRDVGAGESVLGHPADQYHAALRQWASMRTLPEWQRKVNAALREQRGSADAT